MAKNKGSKNGGVVVARGPFDLSSVRNRLVGTIELLPGEIQDHPLQAWDHDKKQADALVGALHEVGVVDRLLVYKSERAGGAWVTPDGHLRKSLDPNFPWPCDVVDLTDEEADYVLATKDPLGQMKRANAEALDSLLSSVSSGNQAVQEMFTEMAQAAGLYLEHEAKGLAAEPKFDRAPEMQAKWQTELGQLWQMGRHVLLCGDATKSEDVARVMGGERAALLVTDPPYNVDIDYSPEQNDHKVEVEYEQFTRSWFPLWRDVSARQIVTPGGNNLALWLKAFDAYYVATWIKTNSMSHGYVSRFFCCEPVLFLGGQWYTNGQAIWKRERANDVFDYPVSAQTATGLGSLTPYHPCPKPLRLWIDLIENYSEVGDIVADAFDGSGTTIMAAEETGRVARCVEIEPKFVAVALERFCETTGIRPVLIDAA